MREHSLLYTMMFEAGVDIGTWSDSALDIDDTELDSQPLNMTATRCDREVEAGSITQMHSDAVLLKHAPFHCKYSPVPASSSRDTWSGMECTPADCGTHLHPKHNLQNCCCRQTHP